MFMRPVLHEDPNGTKVAVCYLSQLPFLPPSHFLSGAWSFLEVAANILNANLPLGFRVQMTLCSVTRATAE